MIPLKKLYELKEEANIFGFVWPHASMILDQVISEGEEVRVFLSSHESPQGVQEEVGDLLHAVFSLCEFLQLDIEVTMAQANEKFNNRLTILKDFARRENLSNLYRQSRDFILNMRKQAKAREATSLTTSFKQEAVS